MRILKGIVVSHKMQKTAVVRVDRFKKHNKYQKQYRVSRKLKAHDEKDEFRVGDVVTIGETRPMSKEKRWRITGLVKRDSQEPLESDNEIDRLKEPNV